VDAMIGGEESGGYAFPRPRARPRRHLAGLYLLDMMVQTGKKPSQLLDWLFEKVGPHYYDRIDTAFETARRDEVQARVLAARPETIGAESDDISTLDGFQFHMEDGGWLLIRFSGTEPIIRVYTETTHGDKVQDILQDGLRIAGLK
jgi:phosphomannomutase